MSKIETAKEWLNREEWPDLPVDSDAFSHYTTISKIMEQYAIEYYSNKIAASLKTEKSKINKYL